MTRALRQKGYASGLYHFEHPRLLQTGDGNPLEDAFVYCFTKIQKGDILERMPKLRHVYTLPEYAGFPQKEIQSPTLIRSTAMALNLLEQMPNERIRHWVDARRNEAFVRRCGDTIDQIERYLDRAITRMREEDIIPSTLGNTVITPKETTGIAVRPLLDYRRRQ